jgi:ATP diphosphatase
VGGVLEKLREECGELEQAVAAGDQDHIAEELGDVLFSAVNAARKLKLDPEVLMTAANAKFERRFTAMEKALAAENLTLEAASLEVMESAWQAAKTKEIK